jgi:hypothetical protein
VRALAGMPQLFIYAIVAGLLVLIALLLWIFFLPVVI